MGSFSYHVGQRIKKYRKSRGYTIEQFSAMINKSKATLSKYENGTITIDIETLYDISKALDIVDSGLKASVDMDAGGELAKNLVLTYELVIRHLMQANLNADDEKLKLAESILRDLGSAWREACDTPNEPTRLQVQS